MATYALTVLLLLQTLPQQEPPEARLPSGKSRTLAILQRDYKKSKKDVAEIIKLAQELQAEIQRNEEFVVDVDSIRKAEKIEKLSKNIKNRFRRLQ